MKPLVVLLLGFLLAIGIIVAVTRANTERATECEAKGGAVLMSASGYACLRAEVIK